MSMMVCSIGNFSNDFDKVKWSGTIYSIMETKDGLMFFCSNSEKWSMCNPKVQEAYSSYVTDRELLGAQQD